jgi:tRNA A37 threonylcarbamoyladenosine modification protein TsaB
MIPGSAGQLLNVLAKDRKRLFSAEGVCVVAGPGSFSSVRTGVLYANLLSRLLRIPLVGVTVEEASDLDALSRRLLDTRYSKLETRYVAPIYDAEPNITVPRP